MVHSLATLLQSCLHCRETVRNLWVYVHAQLTESESESDHRMMIAQKQQFCIIAEICDEQWSCVGFVLLTGRIKEAGNVNMRE